MLAIAEREQRILITNDRDFGELVFRLRQPHAGVILLRLTSTRLAAKIEGLDQALMTLAGNHDQFLVVSDRGVRVGQRK